MVASEPGALSGSCDQGVKKERGVFASLQQRGIEKRGIFLQGRGWVDGKTKVGLIPRAIAGRPQGPLSPGKGVGGAQFRPGLPMPQLSPSPSPPPGNTRCSALVPGPVPGSGCPLGCQKRRALRVYYARWQPRGPVLGRPLPGPRAALAWVTSRPPLWGAGRRASVSWTVSFRRGGAGAVGSEGRRHLKEGRCADNGASSARFFATCRVLETARRSDSKTSRAFRFYIH